MKTGWKVQQLLKTICHLSTIHTTGNICSVDSKKNEGETLTTMNCKVTWWCAWPGGWLDPGCGRAGHGALDLLQLPQDGLRLVRDLRGLRGRRDVGEARAPRRELVRAAAAAVEGLGLGHLLGDGLDADILVESHLARLGDAGVLGPEGGGPLHLHTQLLLELSTSLREVSQKCNFASARCFCCVHF